ncbi:uncharacterized protein PFL1_06256 [Pseudozyma flocculosa PF-1]|uniref:Uncharacterized protein n=2 Tax=Pseudozyma flocculosa TaxID=84751 RepID=A0A5C3F741_9BASI|nr:uncharacterized protein PFL1_06256 [Pseudozyma flocculosa PF-1]EPQ26321.1 hypothetical protein PFL1_06256 [Pseudozyma flocculosa PF-1]SPO40284.1 uncharacterized protein PSFLO_05766 [Pseudozyma flocculosa]
MAKYLISKLADPFLGIGTGIFSYFLWEMDGRNLEYRPQGRTLVELVQRRIGIAPPITAAQQHQQPQ